MTLPESILSRLEKFNEYVTELKTYRQPSLDRFKQDHLLHHATERCLQLAIESVLDIGSHLIAAKGFREPRDYEDILAVLEEQKVVPAEFTLRLRGVGKFRNLLVHEYVDLDLDRLHDYLARVEDLELLAKTLVQAIQQI
ncbi:MAG: DUF86 domain-containing protein [Candidatus Omnitrophica bacterium]|nr:DUF86 domain-containing protein [Candidatus Omnitrophota bacterium]